jgi:hypothetical protein
MTLSNPHFSLTLNFCLVSVCFGPVNIISYEVVWHSFSVFSLNFYFIANFYSKYFAKCAHKYAGNAFFVLVPEEASGIWTEPALLHEFLSWGKIMEHFNSYPSWISSF